MSPHALLGDVFGAVAIHTPRPKREDPQSHVICSLRFAGRVRIVLCEKAVMPCGARWGGPAPSSPTIESASHA